ncbi:hypothetical protein PsorP6_011027 [Peronosclerospora sorghi]|uniref:Uncharacterized protein n=1 Tax=Peronosclerospora sorghi TaxID=230839 RepID=A0ACC0VWT5_9STRA|nr:hypothetical protein PsorP6_011027 [Peronosclerospora sorghi]
MLRTLTSRGRSQPLRQSAEPFSCSRLPLRQTLRAWSSRMIHRQVSKRRLHSFPSQAVSNMSEPEMVRRLMRSQRMWWWVGSFILGGVGIVAFGPELKLGMSKHTADVASRSLQDETLRDNTRALASQIVQTVLNDPKVLDQASMFLQRLLMMESTRGALQRLVTQTLQDPQTRSHVAALTKQTVRVLLDDPETVRQMVDFLRSAVVAPETKEALMLLLDQLMHDDQTRANVTHLLAHTLLQDIVKQSVGETLRASVHDVLNRRDVQDHTKEFISDVIRDQTVQAQGGEAIWETFKYALTPTWLTRRWETPVPLSKEPAVTTPVTEAAKVMVTVSAANSFGVSQKTTDEKDGKASTIETEACSKRQVELKSEEDQKRESTPSTAPSSHACYGTM